MCDIILGIHDSSVGHGTVHSARRFRKLLSFVRVVNAYNVLHPPALTVRALVLTLNAK